MWQNGSVCTSLPQLFRNIWKHAQEDHAIAFLQTMWILPCQDMRLLTTFHCPFQALRRLCWWCQSKRPHWWPSPSAGQQCSSRWALCCAHLATCSHSTQGSAGSPAGHPFPGPFPASGSPGRDLPVLLPQEEHLHCLQFELDKVQWGRKSVLFSWNKHKTHILTVI